MFDRSSVDDGYLELFNNSLVDLTALQPTGQRHEGTNRCLLILTKSSTVQADALKTTGAL